MSTPRWRRFGALAACFGLWCGVAGVMLEELAVRHTATLFADYDNAVQSFPWMSKLTRAWRAGEPPLWDFETFSGESFVGELQTAPFYPPHVAFALSRLPLNEVWLDRYLVLHFAIGAFLMYWMLRRQALGLWAAAVGALLFAFVGTVGQKAGGQMNIFCGMVWLPGAFGCALSALSRELAGPWSLAAATCLALALLAGHPAPFIYAVVAIGLAVVLRVADVPVRTAALRAAVVVALALMLAAPQLLPTVEYMARAYRWVGMDEPIFALDRVPYAVFARAEILHLHQLVSALQPSWDPADGATLFVTVSGLALAVLGAIGGGRLARFGLALAVLSLLVALGEEGGLAWLFYRLPLIGSIREPIRMLFLYQFAIAILAALGVSGVAARLRPHRLGRLAGPVALVVVAADVRAHVDRLYHPADAPGRPSVLYGDRPAVAWLRERMEADRGLYRMRNYEDALPENLGNVMPALRSTSGHRATMPRGYFELLATDWSLAAPHWDLLGARYLVSAKPLDGFGEPRASDPFVYERASALPVFQLAANDGSRSGLTPRSVRWSTNSVELELSGPVHGLLVFAQPTWPGWRASADGDSRPLVPAGPFSGVVLTGQERVVQFAYRPASAALGFLAMVAALALCAWVHVRSRASPAMAEEPGEPAGGPAFDPAGPALAPLMSEVGATLAGAARAAGSRVLRAVSRWEAVGVVVLLGAYLAVALFRAGRPGLYYDELAFVPAALDGPSDMFVGKRLFGVPVLLMPYLGALKSLLYFPVFKVFGVSEASIRFPTIALTMLTLIFIWRTLRHFAGPAWALAGLLLISLDPALVYHVRYDWGPVCLMLLLQAVLLWSALQWLATGRRRYAVVALAAIVLGTYDKLNFLWISNALVIAVAVVHNWRLREMWRADPRGLVAVAAALGVFLTAVVAFRVIPTGMGDEPAPATLAGWGERVEHVAAIMETALSGNAVFEFIFGRPIDSGVPIRPVAAAALGLVLLLWPRWREGRLAPLGRLAAFCALAWLLVFVQTVLTPAAGGSHHFMTLWLFPWLGLAASLALLTELPPGRLGRRLAQAASAGLIAFIVLTQLRVHAWYVRALDGPYRGTPPWSPAITDLARAVPRLPADTEIHCVDWGLCTQILALGPTDIALRLADEWPAYADMTAATVRPFFDERVRGKRVAFVTFARGREMFERTRQSFDSLVSLDPAAFSTVSFGDGGGPAVELHLHQPR